jgi:hypothetical protein
MRLVVFNSGRGECRIVRVNQSSPSRVLECGK